MKVLLVDDLEMNRKLLRIVLGAEEIKTEEAVDGLDALAVLERERFDVIVSDILMPRMDGYRLCQEVRRSAQFGDIPFVFYTGTYLSAEDEKLALDCGANRYLKKPVPSKVLVAVLRELTDPGSRRRRGSPGLAEETLLMKEYNEAIIHKLEERNARLEEARATIVRANEELERRVEERTAELVAANQELEAFSQTVAHDLRAPITVIDGFSEILIEDCRGKVDDKIIERLQFISKAARRMNELTSDLLDLARASRAELKRESVDLSALAAAILADLRQADPARPVTEVIAGGLVVEGDRSLLLILLENLLGNAWKFSDKTPCARVELGRQETPSGGVYWVRDNGAGFAMEAADRLFQTFERLHSQDEFSGTGIGLTTALRIVKRHGGRIWAESAVGKGATFYFTLG